jgi:hypothetical protein
MNRFAWQRMFHRPRAAHRIGWRTVANSAFGSGNP